MQLEIGFYYNFLCLSDHQVNVPSYNDQSTWQGPPTIRKGAISIKIILWKAHEMSKSAYKFQVPQNIFAWNCMNDQTFTENIIYRTLQPLRVGLISKS